LPPARIGALEFRPSTSSAEAVQELLIVKRMLTKLSLIGTAKEASF
jgi:hypothetical protein